MAKYEDAYTGLLKISLEPEESVKLLVQVAQESAPSDGA